MRKNIVSMLLLCACVMLIAGTVAYADGERQPAIDPLGQKIVNGGVSADVNGFTANKTTDLTGTGDGGGDIDPNGLTAGGDVHGTIDPDGAKASGQSSYTGIGSYMSTGANISGSLMGAYISLLPRSGF